MICSVMADDEITRESVTSTIPGSFSDPPRTQRKAYDQQVSILPRFRRLFGGPAISLFLFFLTFYYFTNAGWYKGGDESALRSVAMLLAQYGKLGFQLKHPIDKSTEGDIVRGGGGSYYFKYGLGQSLVEVPFYLGHRVLFSSPLSLGEEEYHVNPRLISEVLLLLLCPSLISALGCALVFSFGMRLQFPLRISLLLSLIYGLCTMAWPYSKSFMSEATLNVAVLGGVYSAVSYVTTRRPYWMVALGTCVGFAFITKPVAGIIIPVLIIYLFACAPKRRTALDLGLWFGVSFAAFLCTQLWYNLIRYGSIFQFGYTSGRDSLGFGTPLYVGLWGLFASPGKSFFLYTPVSILGLASMGGFLKRHRAEALLFMAVCIVYILPHAAWWAWAGDWAWGPRFLLVITPYIILPIGMFFETWAERSGVTKVLAGILILFSLSIQFLGVSIHPYSYILARSDVIDRFVDLDTSTFTYAWTYKESAFSNFSPMFSHIVGNWWLFKHMIFSYDLWSDVPWRRLGDFHLNQPLWVEHGRTIPFWWPVSLPILVPGSRGWVIPLAVVNLLIVVWWGFRLQRFFRVSGIDSIQSGLVESLRSWKKVKGKK
jgi:hypothetical protein